jgi:hypothetical protein
MMATLVVFSWHVERSRDISYHFCPSKIEDPLFEIRDSLDSARNDKDAQAVGGATGPTSPAISRE